MTVRPAILTAPGASPRKKFYERRGTTVGGRAAQRLPLAAVALRTASFWRTAPSQRAMLFAALGQQPRYRAELGRLGGFHGKDRRHAQDGAGDRQVRVSELVHRAQEAGDLLRGVVR